MKAERGGTEEGCGGRDPATGWDARPLGAADLVVAAALALVAAAVLLPGLGAPALANWDEASYGIVVRSFLADPGLSLRDGAVPYLEKPPLAFWMMSASAAVLGLGELALRLPAALLGIGSVVLVFLAGRRLGGRWAGLLAAALLLGVPQFVAWARLAMTDVPLTFFSLLSTVLVLYSDGKPRLLVAAGAAFGLAILVKQVAAFLFVPGILLLLVARRGVRSLVSREALLGVLAALAVAVPWHAWELAVWGRRFVGEYFLANVLQRVLTPLENHAGSPFFYFTLYRFNAGVLAYVHVIGVALAAFLAVRRRDATLGAVALYALVPFLVVNAMDTKIGWYLLPTYPGAALAAALVLVALFPRLPRAVPRGLPAAAVLVLIALLTRRGVAYGRSSFARDYNIQDFSPDVRALAGRGPFDGAVIPDWDEASRRPLLRLLVVSPPAARFYLTDRVEEVEPPDLARLAETPGPLLCLTFAPNAKAFLAHHPATGLRVVATTPNLTLLRR